MTLLYAEIGIALGALFFSILFSASEAALLLMNPDRYADAVSRRKKAAYPLKQLLSGPERMMVSVLVANTIANAVFVAVSTTMFVSLLGFRDGILLSVVLLAAIVTIFAELFPKVLAGRFPVAVAIWTAYPVYLVFIIAAPFTSVLKGISNLFYSSPAEVVHRSKIHSGISHRALDSRAGLRSKAAASTDETITEDELRTYLHISRREGVLDEDEEEMIDSVFEFSDTFVREVMTSRTEISSVDIGASLSSVLDVFAQSHHSRLLVTGGESNEELGVLYSKDLLPWILEMGQIDDASTAANTATAACKSTVVITPDFNIESIMREPVFIPEVMKTDALLQELQERHVALAIVVDEYGSTVGLVTIEDLLEELFGEIIDETDDEEERRIYGNGHNGWIIDARLRQEEVFDEIAFNVPSGDFDTIGGFVFHKIGKLPVVGDRVESEGNVYIVRAMDGRRIETLELYVGEYEGEENNV